ncbi:MAG: adenosine deaminase [Planctomycetota bacterium]
MIDLHRHFEGSFRPSTAVQLARRNGDLPARGSRRTSEANFRIDPAAPRDFTHFLSFFLQLRKLIRSVADLERLVAEVIADAHADGVTHLDLRFSPQFLVAADAGPVEELATAFLDSADREAARHKLAIGYIVTLTRDYGLDGNRGSVVMLKRREFAARIAGIDIAGNEGRYPIALFKPVIDRALNDGKFLTLHAGEAGSAANVREAIEWGATRIGHGIRVVDSRAVMALARKSGVVFEVCPQSNLLTGVVKSVADHPLPRMIAGGLRVTINSDDPGLMGTTLSSEFDFCRRDLGLSPPQLAACRATALETFCAHTGAQQSASAAADADTHGSSHRAADGNKDGTPKPGRARRSRPSTQSTQSTQSTPPSPQPPHPPRGRRSGGRPRAAPSGEHSRRGPRNRPRGPKPT